MAFSSTTLQPLAPTKAKVETDHTGTASLLSMLVLTVYAAQKSKKNFRRLKRRFLLTTLKLKMQSLFSRKKAAGNDRILIYILLGVIALVLVFYYPLAALILAAVALILVLTGNL